MSETAAVKRAGRRGDLRKRLSDKVNRIAYGYLRRHKLWVFGDGWRINLALTFRSFQLVYLEAQFKRLLLRRKVVANATVDCEIERLRPGGQSPPDATRREAEALHDIDSLRLDQTKGRLSYLMEDFFQEWIVPLGRLARRVGAPYCAAAERTVTRVRRLSRKIKQRFGQQETVHMPVRIEDPSRISRLFFVDAEEILYGRLDDRQYVYQKYLEGLLDFDGMDFPSDTCVVLYGDTHGVDDKRKAHRNVVLLQGLMKARDRRLGPAVEHYLWQSFFEDRGLADLVPPTAGLQGHELLAEVVSHDLQRTVAALRLLSLFDQPLEIYLDNYDSRLFSLGQCILANLPQHRVVAIQRVLGPYTFSFNVRGANDLFLNPHKILTWSKFHNERLRLLGYQTSDLESACMYKLHHYRRLPIDKASVKARLGIPEHMPVIMFSPVQSVIGFSLLNPWEYVQMVNDLSQVACRMNAFIIFKPWPGEDAEKIRVLASSLVDARYVILHSSRCDFHNAELLTISDVHVSTVSSFIGEAWFFGAVPILVDSPAARAYFSRTYTRAFRQLCYVKDEHVRLEDVLREVVGLDEAARTEYFKRSAPTFSYLFGDIDAQPPL